MGMASSEVPVSTMAWQPEEQATVSSLMVTLGRGARGEVAGRRTRGCVSQNSGWGARGAPQPAAGAAPVLPLHGDLPVGFSREGDPADAVCGVGGVDGTEEDKAAALVISARGELSAGGSHPTATLMPVPRPRGASLPSSSAGPDAVIPTSHGAPRQSQPKGEGNRRKTRPRAGWLRPGLTRSGRQRRGPWPPGLHSSCCRRQGWLRRRRCWGKPAPGCHRRGCSRRYHRARSQPARRFGR